MSIVFYMSGHGFGHAARTTQVVNALARRAPSLVVRLRTDVPEWFLRSSLQVNADILPGPTDVGVVQPDSVSVDEDETARRAAAFYARFDERAADECRRLTDAGASLVVGDIPPVAFAAAEAARVPSIAFGNFTWDWIYEMYPQFHTVASGVREQIAAAYGKATRTLRLPFAGGFASMRDVEDIPLVARRASRTRADTRKRLALSEGRPIVLASFGGHSGTLPLERASRKGAFTLVATVNEVGNGSPSNPNLRVVTAEELRSARVSYTDLLAASDVVVAKLGYGIVSECIANRVPLLYTTRGRFREEEIFEREMPEVLRSKRIDRETLIAGDWHEPLAALLAQPDPPFTMPIDGADVAATRILQFGETSSDAI